MLHLQKKDLGKKEVNLGSAGLSLEVKRWLKIVFFISSSADCLSNDLFVCKMLFSGEKHISILSQRWSIYSLNQQNLKQHKKN